MANSTTHLDVLTPGSQGKEYKVNALFDAASPAMLYGRHDSACSGLVWGYYGGTILINGALTQIADGTISLNASATNYVEANPASGAVSANTTGFTAGYWPLYQIVTGSSTVTSYTDYRQQSYPASAKLQKALSDANTTLTAEEARNRRLQFTGTLTAQRNIVVPLLDHEWVIYNGTTGGFGLQIIGASGTGIVVAAGKRAIVYADGTNIVRVTSDT